MSQPPTGGDPSVAVERALAAAGLYRRRGDWEAAWRALDDALAIAPESAAVFTMMGDLNCDQGEYAAAAQCYRRALALEPGRADAEVGLGRATVHLENLAGEPSTERPPAALLVRRRPETALALSLLVPGLGQMYGLLVGRGIAFFVGAMVVWSIAGAGFVGLLERLRQRGSAAGGAWWAALALVFTYHLWAAVDAYVRLVRLKDETQGTA